MVVHVTDHVVAVDVIVVIIVGPREANLKFGQNQVNGSLNIKFLFLLLLLMLFLPSSASTSTLLEAEIALVSIAPAYMPGTHP